MRALKTVLFHLLLSFRWLVLRFCQILMVVFFLSFVWTWLLGLETDAVMPRWVFFALGVLLWDFFWFYDKLIFKLTPEDRDVTLWR